MKAAYNRRILKSNLAFIIGVVMAILLFFSMKVFATAQEPEEPTQPTQTTAQEETIQTVEPSQPEAEPTIEQTLVEEIIDAEEIQQENNSADIPNGTALDVDFDRPQAIDFKSIKIRRYESQTKKNEPQKIERNEEFRDRCRINFAESGNQSLEGQIAVAATILNREQSSLFPDTFYDVINQSGQFSTVRRGEIYANGYVVLYEDIPDRTIEAVEHALNGEDPTEQLLWDEAVRLGLDPEKYAAGGALFFYNPYACGEEELAARECIKVKVCIGDHIFFKVWG